MRDLDPMRRGMKVRRGQQSPTTAAVGDVDARENAREMRDVRRETTALGRAIMRDKAPHQQIAGELFPSSPRALTQRLARQTQLPARIRWHRQVSVSRVGGRTKKEKNTIGYGKR